MAAPIRVLVLEDRAADAALVIEALERSGFAPEWERVETEGQFRARLRPELDLILADYKLPTFDAREAVRILRESGLDVPLVIVTGSVGEEVAVACIREGAADYVLKDRMTRFGEAVRGALRQRELREQNRRVAEELRHKEHELVESQKLEAMGRLAGGVGHDFGNLLTVVSACADLLAASPALQGRDRECVEGIQAATKRAAALTGGLLSFSRRRVFSPRVRNLNEIVGDATKILRRVVGEKIDLVTRLDARDPFVHVDAAHLDQVLLNLVVNARDAMPGGGTIEVETASVNAAGEIAAEPGAATHVRLRVRDSGSGISPEVRPHLFEPFFTTKPPGKGTGLGLSTAFGIVSQSGGTIRVESAPGRGSTFDVILPRAAAPAALAAGAAAPAPQPGELSGRVVLVVEDEAPIRRFVRLLFEQLGCRVLDAPDGPEALEVAASVARIDLLVSDVVMPRMNGPVLARHLRERHPAAGVLFISGYVDPEAAGGAPLEGARYLEKPFTREDLARAACEMLAAAVQGAEGI